MHLYITYLKLLCNILTTSKKNMNSEKKKYNIGWDRLINRYIGRKTDKTEKQTD